MSTVRNKVECPRTHLKDPNALTAYGFLSRNAPHLLDIMLDPANALRADAERVRKVAMACGATILVVVETAGPLIGCETYATGPAIWWAIYS